MMTATNRIYETEIDVQGRFSLARGPQSRRGDNLFSGLLARRLLWGRRQFARAMEWIVQYSFHQTADTPEGPLLLE